MSYNKILVIQTAFLGDLVMTTPLFRELKRVYPEARIDVVVIPETMGIIRNNPYIDDVFLFNKRKKKSKFLSFWFLVKEIRKRRYDVAYSLTTSTTSSLIMVLGNIPKRIGLHGMRFLTHPVTFSAGTHFRQVVVELLSKTSDISVADMSTELFPGDDDRIRARELLTGSSARLNIGIAPGSVRETKKWPEEHFGKLLDMLSGKNISIFFIGSKDDHPLCEKIIRSSSNEKCTNLAGELGLLGSTAVIEILDLMITNDSAPLHMSNAVNTPVLAFFGPTVREYGCYPYRENDKMLEIEMACRPCGIHGGRTCSLGHHDCLRLINPELVYNEIMKYYE